MFPRNVAIAEAAQFSQVSMADYREHVAEERHAMRAKLAKQAKLKADIKAGAFAFAVVFAIAGAVLALGVF